ncbi:MAG TPA: Xaa-Pro aminopeptidase [Micrococcales bacterium]|uniref:Xaa-Pro aminopeptidase n=1 Tax=Miniimonas arenae TaxID=676201 RepID=A0A5C5BEK4_9MICO|nr:MULTISPECIES: aminopeptidase P family protein [Miniimonas]TNU76018.1 aminopeptidase P family protein [Miniimonas arenae]HCX85422.1 Xaa-Pro aminopeptidase [Micrococcales bacterium]
MTQEHPGASASHHAQPQPEDFTSDQPVADRGSNRSHRPSSDAFRAFMRESWAPREATLPERHPAADHAADRRARLGAELAGSTLVVPAGPLKVRSNDTDYAFRPHAAFAHLTGLGTDLEPDAVLVLHALIPAESDESDETADDATDATPTDSHAAPTHEAVLYTRPMAGRDSEEFYGDARYGEFWVGRRWTLDEAEALTGLRAAHIDDLRDALAKDAGNPEITVRVLRGADDAVASLVDVVLAEHGRYEEDREHDDELATAVSELRLVKDEWEIDELRAAVAATVEGFEKVVAELPRAVGHHRGERVVEGIFAAKAREEGNAVGYDTIAAGGDHATTLHWIRNTGALREGELLLLDAGVEVDSLYTADVTRTIPVDGTFTEVQRRVYEAVREAADAAFAVVRPGAHFRDVHAAAMRVLAHRLEEWGLLPVSAEESLTPAGQQHRRWMPHGTSHHLGLDVHDCAQARAEMYLDAVLEPGMVFTIEPGLYFKADDLAVPPEYRGIGVRIEDDVLVTADGWENLSAALPRTADDVEAWLARLLPPA